MAGGGKAHLRDPETVLMRAEDLVVEFPLGRGRVVKAVSGISLDVKQGETLGLVGESGCGKSTTAKSLIQLPPPTSGTISYSGIELTSLDDEALRTARTDLQMIFQDPISSLNPRRRIGDVVAEPLRVWGPHDRGEQTLLVNEMLEAVGIDPAVALDKRPHEFSGGQCQRISIARALVLNPQVIICDEPVSALDVSVQAQILNMLEDLKSAYGLTLVFIAHDLAVVKNISDRVAVMYLGKLCEVSESNELYENPAHPYTELLFGSSPLPDPTAKLDITMVEEGDIPSPIDPPSGCRFRTRCEYATERCAEEEPIMRKISKDHFVACHHPLVPVSEMAGVSA
ncbi:MAG: peptide ABC transporter ATP-binding protein [marine actinobacterium MedAcidi-G3]|nr:MAG: peptide ABC transporter ATP-binding protein [marine actinobacterium MedAcidi-G3]MBA4812066.1 ATP-binding cassette domain-containing protein [Acidimicrobiales bacterium]OUW86783.1 MAG: ABC transporter ATP-binding protein [Acidimicrobiaceae bacterium TMED224]|tara:strand:+ start:10742 stop:11764 length:1023 start_codon:yes stop_codon:yes gene_type:complete